MASWSESGGSTGGCSNNSAALSSNFRVCLSEASGICAHSRPSSIKSLMERSPSSNPWRSSQRRDFRKSVSAGPATAAWGRPPERTQNSYGLRVPFDHNFNAGPHEVNQRVDILGQLGFAHVDGVRAHWRYHNRFGRPIQRPLDFSCSLALRSRIETKSVAVMMESYSASSSAFAVPALARSARTSSLVCSAGEVRNSTLRRDDSSSGKECQSALILFLFWLSKPKFRPSAGRQKINS